ncbi:MAG: hypothetical protein O3A71_09875, partial [Proteobacteria bacterium]|nr:hypothetical protein [Pseudomonadota bacterium]
LVSDFNFLEVFVASLKVVLPTGSTEPLPETRQLCRGSEQRVYEQISGKLINQTYQVITLQCSCATG